MCYLSIAATLAKNPLIQTALTHIHNMTHPLLRPRFLSEAEVTATPQELLAQDFVTELGIDLDENDATANIQGSNLRDKIKLAMETAGFDEQNTNDLLLHLFDETDSSDSYFFAAPLANDNARRSGFCNFRSLHLLTSADESFDRKSRIYDLSLPIPELVKLAESSPLILTNEPAHFYRTLILKFCRAPCRPLHNLPHHPRIQEIISKTRQNAIRAFFRPPDTLTLNDSAWRGLPPHRLVPRKLPALILKTGNKRELTLAELDVFSCFLCPAKGQSKTGTIHESLTGLTDPSLAHLNINRILPHDGSKQILSHIQAHHLAGSTEQQCYLVIPCKECIQAHLTDPSSAQLESAFFCCASCSTDHALLLHKDSDRLVSLYSSLLDEFQCNNRAKEILQKYLFCKCIACGALLETQEDLHTHQLVCFASFASLSSGFGRPLTSQIFFTNTFLKQKEDEEANDHAKQQLTKIVKSLSSAPNVTPELAQRAKGSWATLQTTNFSNPKASKKNKSGGKRGSVKSSLTPAPQETLLDHEREDATESNASASLCGLSPSSTRPTHASNNSNDSSALTEEELIWCEAAKSRRAALLLPSFASSSHHESGENAGFDEFFDEACLDSSDDCMGPSPPKKLMKPRM